MAGGLMQLVAYGAQDVYLTGNPQITFFKVVYRRHTNFSMEVIEQNMSGSPGFGRTVSVTVLRNGDLATKLYLKVIVDKVVEETDGEGYKFAWVRRLGHEIIKSVKIQIGGADIDKHYSTWLDVWYELTHTSEQERGYKKCIGDVPEMTELTGARSADGVYKDQYTMFVPLRFWFCENPGLALPLIALQYHEVRLEFEFNTADELCVRSDGFKTRNLTINDASLLVDYVYLDTEERRRFAQVGHEYLIEQLQFTGEEAVPVSTSGSTNMKPKLQFNHPSKELIWGIKSGNFTTGKHFLAYTHEDDWTSALDDAAYNLAKHMFTVSTSQTLSGYYNISAGGPAPTSTTGHGLTTHYVNIDVSGVLATGNYLQMKQDIFYDDATHYNLGDKLDFIAVTVTSTAVENVKVLAHTLKLRDISIPVDSDVWTDNRLGGATATQDDIIVYQHHNFGVLLNGTGNPVDTALIQLNGSDRFEVREGPYFNYVQPLQHHTRTPADGINVYSFALHPEQHQPSGTANLSRIDSTVLNLTLKDPTIAKGEPSLNFFTTDTNLFVFDRNYNVLRIMSGMGGVAYAN